MDLFISYAGPDRPWAEWAAYQLTEAGYEVELDVWDWAAGDNAVLRMTDALDQADRVLALLSKAYLQRDRFTTDEWTAVMADRPDSDGARRLIPIRSSGSSPDLPHPDRLATTIISAWLTQPAALVVEPTEHHVSVLASLLRAAG